MAIFTADTTSKLIKFNHREIKKGEVFLLARAISDHLPLIPPNEDNVKIYNLRYKTNIADVIYSLNDYMHISQETQEFIYKLIDELTLWRSEVAYNPSNFIFKGDPCNVIDDLSLLPKYVTLSSMLDVGDIILDANYTYSLFRTVVKERFNKSED